MMATPRDDVETKFAAKKFTFHTNSDEFCENREIC